MSNSNGTNSFARSLNGIITYDDGAGTVIQNGTVKTEKLAINNIQASNLATDCILWEYNTGVSNYSTSCLGTVNFATGSKGNVNIGPVAGATSSGALNIGTATNLSGNIVLGSQGATGSVLKLQSYKVECQSAPTTANGVVNKTYADTNISNLLAGTNIWTGPSNTFNNPIYASLITPLASGNNLSIGGSLSPNTFIQNSNGLIIGKNPETYSTSTGYMTGEGIRFTNDTNTALMDFHSTTSAGQQDYTGRIIVQNGTGVKTGTMSITAGTISIEPVGNLTLGTDTNTNKIGKLTIDSNNFDTSVVLGDLNIGISNAGKLNIGGQSPTVFGGGTQIKGNVIDLFSAGTLTIGSANTTNISIGQSTTGSLNLGVITAQRPINLYGPTYFTNNNIQTIRSDYATYGGMQVSWNRTSGNGETNLISYQGPGNNGGFTLANVNTAGTYQELISAKSGAITLTSGTVNLTATGGYTNINGINNASCQFIGGGSAMYLDFHSYNGTPTAFDGRIRCDGADGTTQGGTMAYIAKKHEFDGGPVNFWQGMSFQNSNVINTKIITGLSPSNNFQIGGNATLVPSQYQAFKGFTFTGTPIVQISMMTKPGANNLTCCLICSVESITTTGFTFNIYNTRGGGTAPQYYNISWIAIGQV